MGGSGNSRAVNADSAVAEASGDVPAKASTCHFVVIAVMDQISHDPLSGSSSMIESSLL